MSSAQGSAGKPEQPRRVIYPERWIFERMYFSARTPLQLFDALCVVYVAMNTELDVLSYGDSDTIKRAAAMVRILKQKGIE